MIPVEAAAEVLAGMALVDEPRHRLVNAGCPEAPTLRTICEVFAQECGFPRPRTIPLPLLRCAALAGDVIATIRPNFPLSRVNLRKLTTPTVVDSARLYATLPELRWPTFAEALKAAAEFYRTV